MAGAPKLNVEYRVGTISAFFIVATALFFDAVGFLLTLTVIGSAVVEIMGITGSIMFFVWFMFLGANYLSGRATQKLGVMAIGALVEVIPFINGVVPTFIIATSSLIYITRKEDREKAAEKQKALEIAQARSVATTQKRIALLTRRQMVQQAMNDEERERSEAA